MQRSCLNLKSGVLSPVPPVDIIHKVSTSASVDCSSGVT